MPEFPVAVTLSEEAHQVAVDLCVALVLANDLATALGTHALFHDDHDLLSVILPIAQAIDFAGQNTGGLFITPEILDAVLTATSGEEIAALAAESASTVTARHNAIVHAINNIGATLTNSNPNN